MPIDFLIVTIVSMMEKLQITRRDKKDPALPTGQELLDQAAQESRLSGDENITVLIEKLDRGILDSFDGETIALLEKVLKDNNSRNLLHGIRPYLEAAVGALGPKLAGIWGGYEGGGIAMKWGEKYVNEAVRHQGRELIQAAALKEAGLFDANQGIAGTVMQWLKNAETASDSSFFQSLAEGTHKALEAVISKLNELYIYVAHLINQAVQDGGTLIVGGMAKTGGFAAGVMSYPAGAIGGYLGVSFLAGAGISTYREVKRSSGFEQIDEYVQSSEKMIENGVKNEDGSDPRQELIVLHKKILADAKQMGHDLKNEEWLTLAAAVRKARVSILREKIGAGFKDRIVPPAARQELEKWAGLSEKIISVVDIENDIAEADLEAAAEILQQFNAQLAADLNPVEKSVYNYNSNLEKAKRYAQAFVSGGLNGTGLPVFLKVMAKLMNFTARRAIPGAGLILKKK